MTLTALADALAGRTRVRVERHATTWCQTATGKVRTRTGTSEHVVTGYVSTATPAGGRILVVTGEDGRTHRVVLGPTHTVTTLRR